MRASVNETDLFYERHGQGPPLLLLHGGMGLDHTYFRPWLDGLGNAAELIYYDHRGNGRSSPPEDWRIVDHQTWTEDLDGLREHLEHENICLFGHSYGGFLALEYALRYPDRVAGLILCNTAPAVDYLDVVLANARARGTAEQIEAVGRALAIPAPDDRTLGGLWREIFPLYFHRPDPVLLDQIAERIHYSAGAWNRSVFNLIGTFNLVDRLSEVRVPTLVLAGRDDWIMPALQGAERLHTALPDSTLVVFEDSGHFPWIEECDAFLSIVREWLHGIHPSRAPGPELPPCPSR